MRHSPSPTPSASPANSVVISYNNLPEFRSEMRRHLGKALGSTKTFDISTATRRETHQFVGQVMDNVDFYFDDDNAGS